MNAFHHLILQEIIKSMWKISVGFVIRTLVSNLFLSVRSYSFNLLVDDKAALTRDFVRGANGSHKTPYYIWIPYIFLAAALCTYLPAWLWHVIGHRATFDIPAMINQLAKMKLSSPEDRKTDLGIMAKHYEKVEQYTRSNKRITDSLIKKMMSACMFFAGGGVLTGKLAFVPRFDLIRLDI